MSDEKELLPEESELYEFCYNKYGEHVVALRCKGSGLQLFDTVKLFAKNNTRAEYEKVKGEAAEFAKKFVAQFNRTNPHTLAMEEALSALEAAPVYATKDGTWLNIRPDVARKIGSAMFKIEGPEADVLKGWKAKSDAAIASLTKALGR